jgi:hypothetical protein
MKSCSRRYRKVEKGEKVYCPDGTAHLIDESNEYYVAELCEPFVKV